MTASFHDNDLYYCEFEKRMMGGRQRLVIWVFQRKRDLRSIQTETFEEMMERGREVLHGLKFARVTSCACRPETHFDAMSAWVSSLDSDSTSKKKRGKGKPGAPEN